jgi:hypothetical protein
MFDNSTIEFLHSGCAVVIGTVDDDARPHASRGWGLTVVDAQAGRVRVLADAGDSTLLANLQPGRFVTVTVAAVTTFQSRQMKGRVVAIEAGTEADEAKRRQYAADFGRDIYEIDRLPMELIDRWTDRPVAPFVADLESSFDQTPGPSAGTALDRR